MLEQTAGVGKIDSQNLVFVVGEVAPEYSCIDGMVGASERNHGQPPAEYFLCVAAEQVVA
jgi:hypothetical protein